jgi:FlaA1/EpsC-like NDP-sugar epimerase
MKELPSRQHVIYRTAQIGLDLLTLSAAFLLAYELRFDFNPPADVIHIVLVQLPFVVTVQFIALTVTGGRSFMWRYTGIAHARSFAYAAVASMCLAGLMRLALPNAPQVWRIPLSVNFFDAVLAFGGAFGVRTLRRVFYENRRRTARQRLYSDAGRAGRKRVLLIGAGQAGVLVANEIEGRGDLDLSIVGFVDDDKLKLGRTIDRKHKVLGTTEDLPELVKGNNIDHVVITIAQASRHDLQRLAKICEEIPVKVRIIPGLYEIVDGRVGISRIRDVQIEDLLGREQVSLDLNSIMTELAGKTVLVTGAGGSIGSELARQVKRFSPAKLLLVERAEFALFNIDRELRQLHDTDLIVPVVADVGDESRMRSIFEEYRPHVIIHAAAHKHVPLMEHNACEAVKNNVFNTRLLAELSAEYEAESFVLISTDKAVRPTSIMGATKRIAELVVQDLSRHGGTRSVAVRFGNVIGSNGSAIPIFQEQIRNGGPLTITDRRMERYFMTIPEAAQLVLQASAIGKSGEVMMLHMGEPVRIIDVAETLITLSGLRPNVDIQIVETGMRPGEKLIEELMFDTEETVPTSHAKIFICRIVPLETDQIVKVLGRLGEIVRDRDDNALRLFLNEVLPEARIECNGAVNYVTAVTASAAQVGA